MLSYNGVGAVKDMRLSKREIVEKLRADWRASGNYEKLEAFDLVSPSYAGATPRSHGAGPDDTASLVREGVLRRPPVGLGKALMDSVKPISTWFGAA
jgi:hypothetical protein